VGVPVGQADNEHVGLGFGDAHRHGRLPEAVSEHGLDRPGGERAEQTLAGLGEHDRERGEIRIAAAALRLAQHDPRAAALALGPVLDGSAAPVRPGWQVAAFLLEAITRDTLGDQGAAGQTLERALDLAEPEGAVWYFLLRPAPALLERHARHRTTRASLIAEILSLLAGSRPASQTAAQPLREPLRESELRVLRYLPTNLQAPEIAHELFVSRNTVKTHMRNLYAKLGTHGRAETVERARALGLLAPSPRRSGGNRKSPPALRRSRKRSYAAGASSAYRTC
jgi:LuxR family transcriptional regulator, maltose regulon positive regulatory protein